MDRIITSRPNKERETCNNADEQPPQLLDSPLPTPRRSCASVDAARRLRCRRDASPLRTQVPFSWESSPGVPKKIACGRDVVAHSNKAREAMPPPPPRPRPPPGRPTPPCPGRNLYYGNTSEASSDDDDDDDRSFSDALDRISSPERIGSSFDRVTSKRFEDIFVGRATSFAKDRSGNGYAAANNDVIDNLAASGRHHSRQWRRGSMRRSSSREEEDAWTPRVRTDPGPMQLMQRIRMDAEAEEMTPRACGLMVFFPWSPRPAVCGFKSPSQSHSQSQHATPRASRAPEAPSHSRRGTTLRDVIKEENEAGSGLPRQQQRGEKRNRDREGWGVASLLDTSKKYCTDARKALSKLSIGRAMDSQSPRVNSDMRRDKLQGRFSTTMPTTVSKLMQPKATKY
ncbi:hypothetical protein PR202_ga09167 [Eleusine coracana subsp. coracana]|uniref:Uncharacterized protein n=1 Tax=Eleusine coracana subsp. coracana TaxID=191504 RepID=A0AAV5C2F8_ELECO|nr:hypothetical protein QOZ80_1AG0038630 [Eleusine coracana subsp. coracana]GJM92676.1 hypothetical protein PR202_ga09167 [Eleusine coracana subsp. coracana]